MHQFFVALGKQFLCKDFTIKARCLVEIEEQFRKSVLNRHALFIRGLLDPTECELIETSNGFAADYKRLLETSAAANDRMMGSADSGALELTEKFRDFKRTGMAGIEACEIRSIILPLLADHVLREANHYIRILEE